MTLKARRVDIRSTPDTTSIAEVAVLPGALESRVPQDTTSSSIVIERHGTACLSNMAYGYFPATVAHVQSHVRVERLELVAKSLWAQPLARCVAPFGT